MTNHTTARSKVQDIFRFAVSLSILTLACQASSLPRALLSPATPTPTAPPGEIRFNVNVVYLADQEESTDQTNTPTPVGTAILPLADAAGFVPNPPPVDTPVFSPTVTVAPLIPATPIPQPMSTPAMSDTGTQTTGQPQDGPESGQVPGPGLPVSGDISLIDPQPGFSLPPELNQLEFKWGWRGEVLQPCELVDGHGFEVRIWPDPATAGGGSIGPMGVVDAVQEQAAIASSCDLKTEKWRFTVTNLNNTPAVRLAGGAGHFYWDIAYIQTEPYYVPLLSSGPWDFYIPPSAGGEPAPTPTVMPTALFVSEPGPRPNGVITLLAPASGHTFPPTVGPAEFKWHWDGPILANSCQPSEGYGFELRIGSTQPGSDLLGVMDVVLDQNRISCDPAAGTYNYTVLDLKSAPGVMETYKGNFRWDGQFQWDVALVSLQPYVPPYSASTPNFFEISLNDYRGPLDPFGVQLICSDFSSWIEAQAVFLAAGGPGSDFHKLDPDHNHVACDELRQ